MSFFRQFISGCFAVGLAACFAVPSQAAPQKKPQAGQFAGKWIVALAGKAPVGNKPLVVELAPDGRVSGHSGCNGYGGTFKVDHNKITFSRMAATLMACPEPLMRQEHALYDAYTRVLRYESRHGKVILLDRKGKPVLTLSPYNHKR
ncbi:MAG: Heat shock protein [Candidatus Tokpelaia hoelldobleri]|uniref:Heat shock protein n=1 Tax=Candidatus Tokpelaia hoelldobleri TaxID=1902579 RepID=A0A1U9JUN0_9HYPH|nr:MAG: Heat shock protein [Candidatus Tokpelaia hoelldoblerii]